MDIEPRKLADEVWWLRSFEYNQIDVLEEPTDYQTAVRNRILKWMRDFLKEFNPGLESSTNCWDDPMEGDVISKNWHQDYLEAVGDKTLLCVMGTGETLIRVADDIIVAPTWNVYAMHRKLWHRGPRDHSIRYTVRIFFETKEDSLEEFFSEKTRKRYWHHP